jgi:hypothetical protein
MDISNNRQLSKSGQFIVSENHISLVKVASVDTRMSALDEIFRMSAMICEVELALKSTKVREQYDPEEIRKLNPLCPCLAGNQR